MHRRPSEPTILEYWMSLMPFSPSCRLTAGKERVICLYMCTHPCRLCHSCTNHIASFPGLACLHVTCSMKFTQISYCKRWMHKAWEWGYYQPPTLSKFEIKYLIKPWCESEKSGYTQQCKALKMHTCIYSTSIDCGNFIPRPSCPTQNGMGMSLGLSR